MLSVYEYVLNQIAELSGDEAKFICPACEKNTISINIKTDKYNCFTPDCNFRGVMKQLLRDHSRNTHFSPVIITKKNTKDIQKSEPEFRLDKNDLELIGTFPIIDSQKILFEAKRGIAPGPDFISITPELIDAVNKNNPELARKLKYYLSINYHLIILYRDTSGEPFTLRFYSFNPQNNKPKKLTLTGQKSGLYGQNKISDLTTRVIFVEGEEKAEVANFYRTGNSTVFLSMPGVQNHKPVVDFATIHPGFEYSILFDNEENRAFEKKESYKLAGKLKKLNTKVTIIELLANKSQKVDLDSYLKTFSENLRKNELKKLIDNVWLLQDYLSKYAKDLAQTLPRQKVKLSWNVPKIRSDDQSITIEQVKEQLPEVINNHNSGILLVRTPPGSGKTFNVIALTKQKNILISVPNRALRNEIAEAAGIDCNISLSEHCENTLKSYTDKMPKDEREFNQDTAQKILNKGHNAYEIFCERNCKLSDICKKTRPKIKTGSIVETHAMTVKRKYLSKFDLTIIDESPINILTACKLIDLSELNKMIDFYSASLEIDLILKTLKKFTTVINENLSGKNLFDKIKSFFKDEDLNFKDLNNALKVTEIKANKRFSYNDIDLLPDRKSLTALIFALESDFRSTEFALIGNEYVFNIDYRQDFPTDKPIIILDATGNKQLLEEVFQVKAIKEFNPKVAMTGINFSMMPNKTFNSSNLFLDDNEPGAELTKIIDTFTQDKPSLVITSKSTEEKLKEIFNNADNVTMDHYGNTSRGSNKHKDNELVICLPPSINESGIIKQAKVFFKNIHTESCYEDVATGYIAPESGKELNCSVIQFVDKRLNLLLNQKREAEIVQALYRIKRDSSEKEFVLLGNISLKDFNLTPDKIVNSFEIYKKPKVNKNDKLKKFIQDFIQENLKLKGFFMKSEFRNLQKYIIDNQAETIANSNYAFSSYNIYYNLIEKTSNSVTIIDTARNIKERQFLKVCDESLKELGLLEKNLPLIGQPAAKIIIENEAKLEAAKLYLNNLLLKKSSANNIEIVVSTVLNDPDKNETEINEEDDEIAYERHCQENVMELKSLYDNYRNIYIKSRAYITEEILDEKLVWLNEPEIAKSEEFNRYFIYKSLKENKANINREINSKMELLACS